MTLDQQKVNEVNNKTASASTSSKTTDDDEDGEDKDTVKLMGEALNFHKPGIFKPVLAQQLQCPY